MEKSRNVHIITCPVHGDVTAVPYKSMVLEEIERHREAMKKNKPDVYNLGCGATWFRTEKRVSA